LKQEYIDTILLVERLHRRFLDVIKAELDKEKIEDINNVQTLILYNINADQLTVGELMARGYYLGSNVSYNVKKLVENGYLTQERSPHDKRSTRVKLSVKGLSLCDKIESLYNRHITALPAKGITVEELKKGMDLLRKMERFWTECMEYQFK